MIRGLCTALDREEDTEMGEHLNAAARLARKRNRRLKHVHPMVADVAVEIIMESYDALMHHNEHWAAFKRQFEGATSKELEQIYLEHNWGKGVEAARVTLARMLDPKISPSLGEAERSSIHEALVLDRSLMMGRRTDAWEASGMRRN
jgi:hypothetical protein